MSFQTDLRAWWIPILLILVATLSSPVAAQGAADEVAVGNPLDTFEETTSLQPETTITLAVGLILLLGVLWYLQFQKSRRLKRKIAEMREENEDLLIQLNPPPEPHHGLDLVSLKQGQEAMASGDQASALAYFDQAVIQEPLNPYAWLFRAQCAAAQAQYGSAFASIAEGIKLTLEKVDFDAGVSNDLHNLLKEARVGTGAATQLPPLNYAYPALHNLLQVDPRGGGAGASSLALIGDSDLGEDFSMESLDTTVLAGATFASNGSRVGADGNNIEIESLDGEHRPPLHGSILQAETVGAPDDVRERIAALVDSSLLLQRGRVDLNNGFVEQMADNGDLSDDLLTRTADDEDNLQIISQASTALEGGDPQTALSLYDQAITRNPFSASAWAGAGSILLAAGDLASAARAYEHAIASNITHIDGWLGKARGHDDLGQYGESWDSRSTAQSLRAMVFQATMSDAEQKRADGDLDGSLASYEQILTQDPSYEAALWGRAKVFLESGRMADVAHALDNVLRVNSAHAPAWSVLAALRYRAGEYQATVDALRRSLEVTAIGADLWFIKGDSHRRLGQFDQAADCFSTAIAQNPDDARYWNNLGLVFAEAGLGNQALRCFERVIEMTGGSAGAVVYLNRARVHEAEGRIDDALADVDTFLQQGSGLQAHVQRGYLLRQLGRNSEAIASFSTALDELGTHTDALYGKAQCQVADGDLAGAAATLDALTDLVIDNEALWLQQGGIERDLGQGAEALHSYQMAANLSPRRVDTIQAVKEISLDLEEYGATEIALDRLVALEPAFTDHWQDMRSLFRTTGNGERLVAVYEVLEGPDHTPEDPEVWREHYTTLVDLERVHDALVPLDGLLGLEPTAENYTTKLELQDQLGMPDGVVEATIDSLLERAATRGLYWRKADIRERGGTPEYMVEPLWAALDVPAEADEVDDVTLLTRLKDVAHTIDPVKAIAAIDRLYGLQTEEHTLLLEKAQVLDHVVDNQLVLDGIEIDQRQDELLGVRRQAAELMPEDIGNMDALVARLEQWDQAQEALDYKIRLANLESTVPRWQVVLTAQQSLGLGEDTLETLETLFGLTQDSSFVQQRVRVQTDLGNQDGALDEARRFLELATWDDPSWNLTLGVFDSFDDPAGKETFLDETIEQQEGTVQTRAEDAKIDLLGSQDRGGDLVSFYYALLEADPLPVNRFDALVGYHQGKSDKEGLVKAWEWRIEREPNDENHPEALIQVYRDAGDTEAIVGVIDDLLEKNPTSVGLLSRKRDTIYEMGEHDRAIEVQETIIENSDDKIAALDFLASWYEELDRKDDVINTFDRMSVIDTSVEIMVRKKNKLAEYGRTDEQLQALQELSEADPNPIPHLEEMIELHQSAGEQDKVLSVLDRMLTFERSETTLNRKKQVQVEMGEDIMDTVNELISVAGEPGQYFEEKIALLEKDEKHKKALATIEDWLARDDSEKVLVKKKEKQLFMEDKAGAVDTLAILYKKFKKTDAYGDEQAQLLSDLDRHREALELVEGKLKKYLTKKGTYDDRWRKLKEALGEPVEEGA